MPPLPFETGLGEAVDRLAALSPALQGDLKSLNKKGWTIQYGESARGSYAYRDLAVIIIDAERKDEALGTVQTLTHEVGHATYGYVADYSSKAAYVNGTLADEGAATLNNIKVRRDILANGGPDIGIAGNPTNHGRYNEIYDQFLRDGDAAAARQAIGAQFGTGELSSVQVGGQHLNYREYYEAAYDKAYPRQP